MSYNINYRFREIMICQCRFINIANIPLDWEWGKLWVLIMGEAVGVGGKEKSLYLTFNFAVNLKQLYKSKALIK